MRLVSFRFYAELNEHLPSRMRQAEFFRAVRDGATLREVLKSLDVSVGEVDLILVNGQSQGPEYSLCEGDRVSVYPVFDAMDVSSVTRMTERPPRRQKFILDVHLGKLAHLLRMLGFDALYRNDYTRDLLLEIAVSEDRILLSRGKSLLDRKLIDAGYCVKSADPREQLIEVLGRFDLWGSAHPFVRCLHCNTLLCAVTKKDVFERLPEKVRVFYDEFQACPACGRIYWMGTHARRMMDFTREVYAGAGEPYPPPAG